MYVMLVTLIYIESVLDRFIDKRESLTNLSDLHCSSRPPPSCSVSSFCRIIVQDDVVIIDSRGLIYPFDICFGSLWSNCVVRCSNDELLGSFFSETENLP